MAIGLLLSWAMEGLLLPRPAAPWQRPWPANLTHLAVWLVGFGLELALFRRPYFAVANLVAIQLVIVLVSRAKYQALREPFVYPDFEYFTDAIKHPRLYLPFFGVWNALAAAAGYGVALWLGLTFEASIIADTNLMEGSVLHPVADPLPFYLAVALLCVAGVMIARWAGSKLVVNFDADDDLRRLGLIAALWAYARAERQPLISLDAISPFSKVNREGLPEALPDLVCIQSESFFDVRRAFPIVKKDVLANFDALCAESMAYGELDVAARGANTVRTEFAFLSGLDPKVLGVHRFNPYRKLARRQSVPTLASYLKALGYRTVCVHPYHGSFYRRDEVLPKLGFEEFIDIRAFDRSDLEGAYVGDIALGKFVSKLIADEDTRPLYVHVITMENHGPLHWETVDEGDVASVLKQCMPLGCEELVAYTRHLRNADEMFGAMRAALRHQSQRALLCAFGDHVPAMSRTYGVLGLPASETDYFIWQDRNADHCYHASQAVANLAKMLLSSVEVI
ncbi:LTA synthase family protein [Bordetella genomosp. 12]|uniref:Sulfatase N-terminal domain-containing protein n=1 Tax=Bordetella genomosp. 12 TaxID=463035 RepID=A0A261VV82_9BORD|nr:LTA synthase family protein [Bordetella genomosp. 12]OZI78006.1 hypothetical protein CAL22_03645 [Bordetella genomosp. 12]